jgi:hypothetical protein
MPPEIADKVAKLLRVACSNGPDGEKLAALNRLSALAAAHDVDWDTALSGANGRDLTREQMTEIYEAGVRAGVQLERNAKGGDWAKAGHSRADEVGEREPELRQILSAAAQSRADGLLDGWFSDFSRDMQERVDRWGDRTRVSPRQWEFIDKLRSILERQDYL